jgi:hypothetical protein
MLAELFVALVLHFTLVYPAARASEDDHSAGAVQPGDRSGSLHGLHCRRWMDRRRGASDGLRRAWSEDLSCRGLWMSAARIAPGGTNVMLAGLLVGVMPRFWFS